MLCGCQIVQAPIESSEYWLGFGPAVSISTEMYASSMVIELNRLCRADDLMPPLSCFVAGCLKLLRVENKIVVSYSDTAMGHRGYIYQACNFIYTGVTKKRTDKYTEGNKHSRHYDNDNQKGLRKIRYPKHRYVYFAIQDGKLKKQAKENLRYKELPYPKGDNKTYKLGQYLKPSIVEG